MSALRAARAALVGDHALRGAGLGRALAGLLDDALLGLIEDRSGPSPIAVVALGSYGRREMCPGSDVDVMLLAPDGRGSKRRPDLRGPAEHLWYPLWDAGFVLGHSSRTLRDALELADGDLEAMTSLLDARHVAGDAALTEELRRRTRQLVNKRRERVIEELATAAALRRVQPGLIAEMLEPDLKRGGGGLRDLQSLDWAGWAIHSPGDASASGGKEALHERGYLSEEALVLLAKAQELLLDLRVTLHRITGGRSDRLVLQEQDAVAAMVGAGDADAMVHGLAAATRAAAWVQGEVWARLRATLAGPGGRVVRADRQVADGVVLREGRVVLADTQSLKALTVLEAAAAASERDVSFDSRSLERLRDMEDPIWDSRERAAFLRLLRAGEASVSVFEALDHVGALVRLLPEWEVVRARPQRNAYHRFTVDRHLLETVAECARLLDAGDAPGDEFDAVVARACRRPDLLLLTALLHDLGKGVAGEDHPTAGAATTAEIARRMQLDSDAADIVTWLVRNHLVMADTATRRDLSDLRAIRRFADVVLGDPERLRLLYLLTIGDSRATGPAAWGPTKAALLRDLFVRTAAYIEPTGAAPVAETRAAELAERIGEGAACRHLAALPDSYALTFGVDEMALHHAALARQEVTVSCRDVGEGLVGVTVVARDRVGLLATVAGALSAAGLAVREASLFTTRGGVAVDAFRAADPFGRFTDESAPTLERAVRQALDGETDVAAAVHARVRNYHRPERARGPVEVLVDLEASSDGTVVEVHADDEVGLLYRLASVFASLGADVSFAKVATLGDRVVDVFYVRDQNGRKIESSEAIAELKEALAGAIASR